MASNLLAAVACIAGVAADEVRGELLFQPDGLHDHGTIHVSYSYEPNAGTDAVGRGESIKHVCSSPRHG